MIKSVLIFFFFFIIELGLLAQVLPFSVDHSFQPDVNLRKDTVLYPIGGGWIHQRAGVISNIWENPKTGKLYMVGDFDFTVDSNRYNGFISFYRDGRQNKNFKSKDGGSGGVFFPINDSVFLSSGAGAKLLIDTFGNVVDLSWTLNLYKSICVSGSVPFFYKDGSSLWSSGGCEIIVPPDTFPGRYIVKVDPEGKWDSSYTIDANHSGIRFMRYDNKRILMYAPTRFIIQYGNHTVNGIWRTYLDGTLDTTFHAPISDAWVSGGFTPVVEENGKIFLKGSFLLEGGNAYHSLVRLNPDGSLDSTFMNHAGPTDSNEPNSSVSSITKTPDGGYLVAGDFNNYQGYIKNKIAKINQHGAVEPQYFTGSGPDSAFHADLGFEAGINEILPSAFEGYYVIGNFTYWNGQPSQPIIRLHGMSVGMEKNGQDVNELALFPNPASESIKFYRIGTSEVEKLLLTDIQGKTLEADFQKTSFNTYEIDIANLKTGIYFLKMISNGEVAVGKFVKQ